jgi:hypothetical protein
LYPAIWEDPQQPPRALDASDGNLFLRSMAELDRLRDATGTHGEIMHDLGMQLSIPGEGYVVGRPDAETGEHFGVYSQAELVIRDDKWVILEDPDDREGIVLDPLSSVVNRVWRQHPKWRNRADSAMRAVLDVCEELQILSRDVRSTGRSRLTGAGILWVPQEMNVKAVDSHLGATDGLPQEMDPFLKALLQHFTTPIQEEGSAAAVVPILVKAKGEHIQQVRHMEFGREYSELAATQREELLRRAANGMDFPAEILVNKGELNHWTMWQVDDSTYKAHLEPFLMLLVGGLTEAFMRPATSDLDREVVIWFDPSDLQSHPARGKDADAALQVGGIGFPAYRRYKGYAESDAPTDEDLEQLERINASKRPVTSNEPGGDTTTGEPPPEPTQSIVAAGRRQTVPLAEVGLLLSEMDVDLRRTLQASAQGVVSRIVQTLGARLRAQVLAVDEDLAARLSRIPDDQLAQHLDEAFVEHHFQTDQEVVTSGIESLRASYMKRVAATQRSARLLALQYDDDDRISDQLPLVTAEDDARARGWEALALGLTAVVSDALFAPTAVPTAPTAVPRVSVPAGALRQSLSIAGGAQGTTTEGGAIISAITGGPDGGIATGVNVLDIFAKMDKPLSGWQWVYGDSDDPFEAHENLDGKTFTTWDDPVLSVSGDDAWLGTSTYYPGDHRGCQCDFAPVLSTAEEAAA